MKKQNLWVRNYDLSNSDNRGYIKTILDFYEMSNYSFASNGIFITKNLKSYFILINTQSESLEVLFLKNEKYHYGGTNFLGIDGINKVCRWINNRDALRSFD